jgi:hypothetical protein
VGNVAWQGRRGAIDAPNRHDKGARRMLRSHNSDQVMSLGLRSGDLVLMSADAQGRQDGNVSKIVPLSGKDFPALEGQYA